MRCVIPCALIATLLHFWVAMAAPPPSVTAAPENVTCGGSFNLFLSSSTSSLSIVLENCSNVTTLTIPYNASNIALLVSGGTSVPTLLSQSIRSNASWWNNLTITLVDVSMSSTSPQPTTPIVLFWGQQLSNIHLHIKNSTIVVTHGITSLTGHYAISNSTFLIENSSITHHESYANNSMCSSYFIFVENTLLSQDAAAIGNVSMTVRGNSKIVYETNCTSGASWCQLHVGKSSDVPNANRRGIAWNVTVLDSTFQQHSLVNDTSTSSSSSSSSSDSGIELASGAWDYLIFQLNAAYLQKVNVRMNNFSWSSTVEMKSARNILQTSLLRVSPSGVSSTFYQDIHVTMLNGTFSARCPTKPVLLYFSCDNATGITTFVQQVTGEQVTYGIATGDDASRTIAMVYYTPTFLNASTITLRDIRMQQSLMSGQGTSSQGLIASAALVSASAFVFHMRAGTNFGVTIVLMNVTNDVSASDGGFYSYLYTAVPQKPFFVDPRGLDLTLGSVLVGLVYLEPATTCTSLSLSVESCGVHVQSPISTQAYNTTLTNILAVSHSLILMMSSCTDCVVLLQNSTLSRPPMSSTFGNCEEASASSALLCVNITTTALVQASDPRNFATVWLNDPKTQNIISIAQKQKATISLDDVNTTYLSQSALRNTTLTIVNSTIAVVVPSTKVVSQQLQQERADVNVIAHYLLPVHTYGGAVTLTLPYGANTASSSPAVVGAVLLGCVGNCTISESATIQVNAVASPEPSLKSSSIAVGLRAVLGGVLSRVIIEESSRLSVHRAVFTAQEDRYLPITASKHHAQQFASSRLLYGLVYFMWGNSTAVPLLLVSSSSRITLNQSVLYGFDSALLKITQSSSSSSSSSSSQPQTNAFAVDGYLELGCNLWSGGTTASFSSNEPIALPWQLVGLPRGPRRHIVYVPSTFDGGEAFNASSSHCVGLPTESESISMHTKSMQLVPPAVIDVNPSPSLSKGTTGTVAAATGAAILVSLVGGGVGGISIDLQLLAIFGRSSCAPEALKTATGPSQWLLSPFYLLGSVWMVVGNCAVVGAVILLQLAVVRVISSRSSKPAPLLKPQNAIITVSAAQKTDGKARLAPHSATVTPSFGSTTSADNHVTTSPAAVGSSPQTLLYSWRQDHISGTHHHSHHLTTATANNTAARRARWELGCTRARFPQLSYSVGMLMVSGVISASTTILIFDGIGNDDATFGVVGAIGLCLVLCGWYGRHVTTLQPRVRRFKFHKYSLHVLTAITYIHPFLLPTGRWFPDAARLTHGFLRSSVNPGGVKVQVVPIICSQLAAFVAALPITSSAGCVAQWAVQSAFAAAVCVITVVWRPSRPPIADVFTVINQVMTVGVCILSAIRVAPSQMEDTTSLQAIHNALSVFVMISSINGVVRSLHKLMVRVWEGKLTHADMLIASSLPRKTTPTARAITRRPEHLTSRLTANLPKRTAKDVATLLPVSDDEETSTLYVPPQSSLPSSEFREERVRRWLAAAAASSSHNTTRRQVDDAAATAVALNAASDVPTWWQQQCCPSPSTRVFHRYAWGPEVSSPFTVWGRATHDSPRDGS